MGKEWLDIRTGKKKSAIYLENSKLYFTVYIFVVIGFRKGTRNLSRLYVGVLITNIMGLKGWKLSTNCFWTLLRLKEFQT